MFSSVLNNFSFNLQVSCDLIIPAKIHNTIIGAGGKLIQSIMDDCGGVHIKFPDANSGSDKVIGFRVS